MRRTTKVTRILKRPQRPKAGASHRPESTLLLRLQRAAGNQAVSALIGAPVQRQAEKLPWPEWGPSKKAKAAGDFDSKVAARLAAARKALAGGKAEAAMDSLTEAFKSAAAILRKLPKKDPAYFAMAALIERLRVAGALLTPHLTKEKAPLEKIAANLKGGRIAEAREALAK